MIPAAVIAANRFGLGARPGELAAIGSDPRGWLKAQISSANAIPASIAAQPGTEARLAELPPATMGADGQPQKDLIQAVLKLARDRYPVDAAAALDAAMTSQTSFVERLVAFWSNHFTVSALRPAVAGLIGPFQAEAIRPHLFGRFVDLLKAATLHPAMLLYLDNAVSFGPDSRAGQRRDKGLNENLARELMELHTLGVNGGYTQNDVRELAKILTGWTIHRPGQPERAIAAERGGAVFIPFIHEPGQKTLLGKTYGDAGQNEAEEVLEDLARHPSTARFIATKLARHFIADDPPSSAVATLAETFTKTDGDLAAVTTRLIDLDEAWGGDGKYRAPYDWVVAIFRAFGAGDNSGGDQKGHSAVQVLDHLGQRPFFAPSPAGWPDDAASWLAPESLLARIDYAQAVGKARAETDPMKIVDGTVGPAISAESRFSVEHAPSRPEAIALLLVSPEFLRR
ncbi:MAG TPA: DUF1800 domain-containing protein [Candidatus Cybelea sp.]|nr:DUF1800 domain-containing protein [Candidatus Cybelea sp.]